jgi:hypothetical protein
MAGDGGKPTLKQLLHFPTTGDLRFCVPALHIPPGGDSRISATVYENAGLPVHDKSFVICGFDFGIRLLGT